MDPQEQNGHREVSEQNRASKPTARQVYGICRLLCEREGIEFPRNRQEASDTIAQLKATGAVASS
jgi:hypothetical protein